MDFGTMYFFGIKNDSSTSTPGVGGFTTNYYANGIIVGTSRTSPCIGGFETTFYANNKVVGTSQSSPCVGGFSTTYFIKGKKIGTASCSPQAGGVYTTYFYLNRNEFGKSHSVPTVGGMKTTYNSFSLPPGRSEIDIYARSLFSEDKKEEKDEKKEFGGEDLSLNMEKLKKLAQTKEMRAGDVDAQARLGKNYLDGNQTTKNKEAGEKWLLEASKHKNTPAGKWAEGICHTKGIGTSQDEKAAFACYKEAAEKNYAPALCSLGWCYEYKHGVPKDEKAAFDLYQKSAKQGYIQALVFVAQCYEYGVGISKNAKEALRLYAICANRGSAFAQSNLARCFCDCDCGITLTNEDLGMKFARLAAEQGDSLGQCCLAEFYWNRGEKLSALNYYRLSAEQGNRYSQRQMGYNYMQGFDGLIPDRNQAMHWFALAAAQGDEFSARKLAELSSSCCLIL
ncbi:MAG: sel1 repeat family protein [Proteobacteria bacterium]|nr:sel1 repeat family protein [Pseudomonadota bacterium]